MAVRPDAGSSGVSAACQDTLASRVFMVGNEVTLADLVLLGAVSPAVVRSQGLGLNGLNQASAAAAHGPCSP